MSATSTTIAIKTDPRTGRVRPFEERDLPAVVRLHRCTFASRRMSTVQLETYLAEVFCRHPWQDPLYRSLVFESRPGDVVGCLGVMPRPMTFRGRPITAAISHHFMVDPDQRSTMGALQLLRTFLEGPQQLSMAEGNDLSRRMWQALHATTVPAYSLHWLRPLRPAAFAASTLTSRRPFSAIGPIVRSLAAAGDLAAGYTAWPGPSRPAEMLELETLTPMLLTSTLEKMRASNALWPRYDTTAVAWLFNVLASKRSSGELQTIALRDRRGDVAGWFVYYLRRDAAGEVIQLGGPDRNVGDVFDHLLWHAYQHGAIALTGRLEPRLLSACAAHRCWLRAGGSWMLVRSAHSDIIAALNAGDAWLSPLEGEWWMST